MSTSTPHNERLSPSFEALEERRRDTRLSRLFSAHTSPAFWWLAANSVGIDLTTSLDTRKEVGTSGSESHEGSEISDAREAILQSISRTGERQNLIRELIGVGEVAHAKRFAYCARQSVQLECSDCGSKDNFVPISCNSRLCRRCMNRRMGQLIGKYLHPVSKWSNPTLLTLTVENSDDLEVVDEIRDDFGRFRERVIPTSGSSGESHSWNWPAWKRALSRSARESDLADGLEREFVDEGRGIPVDEVLRSGLYGIDIKQQDSGEYNVHIHVLADMAYTPQAAISSVWNDVSGSPVVDVRRVHDVEEGLAEVVGYVTKPPEFNSAESEAQYASELKGTKLVQPFGELHGNTLDVAPSLRCIDCGSIPMWWTFLGLVDEPYDTSGEVGGSDDYPPPSVD